MVLHIMSFFWVSCQVHRALSGTNDVSFHGFEHCAQKQKEQMQKGCWKYPKQCYKKTLLFFMIMCLSFYLRTLRKKTFENVSRVCKNRKNEYKKFQRIPSRRNGCQFPVMTFSFFLLRINFLNWDYTVGQECKIALAM